MKKITALLTAVLIASVVSGCGGNVPVKITNDLGAWEIAEVWVDPAEDDDWSINRISEVLEPGADISISIAPGTYDIMLVDEDGDSYTRWDVEIGSDGYDWSVTLSDID